MYYSLTEKFEGSDDADDDDDDDNDDDDDYGGYTFVSHRSPSGDVGMDQTHEHKMSFEGAEGRPGETDKHWH